MNGAGEIGDLMPGRDGAAGNVPGMNPATGLASDYLNHLYEPLLILEHLEHDPDLLDDLADWRPRSYLGHFDLSGRSDGDLVRRAYKGACPQVRTRFDALAQEAGEALATALPALLGKAREGENVTQLAEMLAMMLRRYIKALDSIIHGRETN